MSTSPSTSTNLSHLSLDPQTATTLPPQPFRFLDLHTELRLHIYELLLLDPASLIIPLPHLPPTRAHKSKSLHPVILRINRAIHDEALPVLYSGNTFLLRTSGAPLTRSLSLYFGLRNAGLIRRVVTTVPVLTMRLLSRCQVEEIDCIKSEAQLKTKYAPVGVRWGELKFWACRVVGATRIVNERGDGNARMAEVGTRDEDEVESVVGKWVEQEAFLRMGEEEVEGLGVRVASFRVGEDDDEVAVWVVKRGSLGRA